MYSTDVWKYFNKVCEYEQQLHFSKYVFNTCAFKAVNREDKLSRRYRDRDLAKFESSRRYRER
jgi:hypothetical protein